MVVHVFHAVQGNAHVGEAHFFEFARLLGRDQGAVGGDHRAHALAGRMAGQLHQILAHQGFAAGKKHHRRAEGRQVVDHGLGLFGIDIIRAVHFHGMGIAVHALEVAALGHVPDNDRFLVLGELQQMRGQFAGFTAVAQCVRRFHLSAVQF